MPSSNSAAAASSGLPADHTKAARPVWAVFERRGIFEKLMRGFMLPARQFSRLDSQASSGMLSSP